MSEEWRTINDSPDYEVSDTGRVRSSKGKAARYLKLTTDKYGYLHVVLSQNDKGKTYTIHRLVLAAFIGQRPKGMEANHIDGDKCNNKLDNLEWITSSGNMIHAYRNGLKTPPYKAVQQLTLGGVLVRIYKSLLEASRQTGVNHGNISSCCLGKLKSAGGFVWRHAADAIL